MDSLLMTPDAAARELSISRSALYELISSNAIETIKIGRSRRIPRHALEKFVTTLLQVGAGDDSGG